MRGLRTVALDATLVGATATGSRDRERDLDRVRDRDLERERPRVCSRKETEATPGLLCRPRPRSRSRSGFVGLFSKRIVRLSGPATCWMMHVRERAASHFWRSHGRWPVLPHLWQPLVQSQPGGAVLMLPLLYFRQLCLVCPHDSKQYSHMPAQTLCPHPPRHTHGPRRDEGSRLKLRLRERSSRCRSCPRDLSCGLSPRGLA